QRCCDANKSRGCNLLAWQKPRPRGAPNSGWTAGIGIEWAFAGNWSARAEYGFIGLNNQAFTTSPGPAPFGGDVINPNNRNIQFLTVGFNYKSGGWWGTNAWKCGAKDTTCRKTAVGTGAPKSR